MPDPGTPRQVQDDPALFDAMMADQERAAPEYQPTNYWSRYFKETIRVLRQDGLHDFRRQPQGYFRSFGACDSNDTSAMQQLHLERSSLPPQDRETVLAYLDFIRRNPELPLLPRNLSANDVDALAARFCELEGKLRGALPFRQAAPDLVGNPWHSFSYQGAACTHLFLTYYLRYAYLSPHVRFEDVDAVVELGSGAGNQVEILKKLYPHLTFYLADLAPYLYVCHQFLKAVFPGDVVDYRETRGQADIAAPRPGSIVHVGSWQLGRLRPRGRVLFWNAASFGEMEPEVVENYLSLVRPWADAAYLYQVMGGKEVGTAGKSGVLKQTRFEHYGRFLGEAYRLVDRAPAFHPLRYEASSGGYEDALWARQGPDGSLPSFLKRHA